MSTLFSSRWYRVAGLKPTLSPRLLIRRQRVRGETWYVLADPVRGRSLRLNAAAYGMAARLDGERTVQQLWDSLSPDGGDAATQDETIELLAQLREAALVQFDRPADFDLLLPHLQESAQPRGRGNLLAWRVPLGDPTWLLQRLRPVQELCFSRTGLVLWLLAIATLLLQVLQHAPSLWAYGSRWIDSPRFVLLALLLFWPIKLLHELAHGLAVQRWGGRVRAAGVTLMLLMPVPYVDASAASGFVRRRHRMAVAGAGMMAELALAAVAMPLWLWLDDGWWRAAAFMTLIVAGVSTLLFNINPLQRLDGYYLATDALGLPNLGPRSRAWWDRVLRRRLLGLHPLEPMPVARGEAPWLAAYAPLSWLMTIAVASLGVAWVGRWSFGLGVACALVLGWQVVARPVFRLLGALRQAALVQQDSRVRWRRAGVGAIAAALLALGVPWPQSLLVRGVVWPPEQTQLRAEEAGRVEEVYQADAMPIRAGDPVFRLVNVALRTEQARQAARVAALEVALFDALPGGGSASGDAGAELASARAELARLDDRVNALTVRAQVGGRLALPEGRDLPGQHVARGRLVGRVLTDAPPTVRVAVPEAEAGDLRRLAGTVSVRLASSRGVQRAASLARDSGGAVAQLPSAALSVRHGGPVMTDPKDSQDLTPTQPVVLLDVVLAQASDTGGARIGERAWVRFEAGRTPLALHIADTVRREVSQRFNPSF